MGKKVEMIGKRFGRLVVQKETERRSTAGCIYYLCLCDCGKTTYTRGTFLRDGTTKSCGCYNRDIIRKDNPDYKTKLYSIHQNIKQRCNNPDDRAYHNYGGRGISLCEEWNDYTKFKEWALSHGYKQGLWIDRIDNDKDYCPENCRWATPKEQQNNKRTNHFLTINGETKTIMQWSEISHIPYCTLLRRLELGWSTEKLFSPVDKSKSHPEEIRKALKKG